MTSFSSYSIPINPQVRNRAKDCLLQIILDKFSTNDKKIDQSKLVSLIEEYICYDDFATKYLHIPHTITYQDKSKAFVSLYNDSILQMTTLLRQVPVEIYQKMMEEIHVCLDDHDNSKQLIQATLLYTTYQKSREIQVSQVLETKKQKLQKLDLQQVLQPLAMEKDVTINGKVKCRVCQMNTGKITTLQDRLGIEEALSVYVICTSNLCKAQYKI